MAVWISYKYVCTIRLVGFGSIRQNAVIWEVTAVNSKCTPLFYATLPYPMLPNANQPYILIVVLYPTLPYPYPTPRYAMITSSSSCFLCFSKRCSLFFSSNSSSRFRLPVVCCAFRSWASNRKSRNWANAETVSAKKQGDRGAGFDVKRGRVVVDSI